MENIAERKNQSTIIAHQTPFAPHPILTQNTKARPKRKIAIEEILVYIGKALSLAARKNEVDMALGNVIGSNIFNILLVLGVAAAISPMTFKMENIIDIVVNTLIIALSTNLINLDKLEIDL